MPAVASLPVIFGFVPAFYIHWMAVPNGLGCRHFWILGVFFAWIVSAVFTTASYWWLRRSGRVNLHFWVVFVKDALIGLSSITVVFLSVVGLFNSCVCWSLSHWLGGELARFPLNKHPLYLEYKKGIFPIVVGVFVGLQFLFVLAVVTLMWRGLAVMRWGETHKRKEWQNLMGSWRLEARNLFLFWTLPALGGQRPLRP